MVTPVVDMVVPAIHPDSSLSVYVSALPVSRWNETEVGSVLKDWGNKLLTSLYFSDSGKLFLDGSSLLVLSSASWEDGMMQAK